MFFDHRAVLNALTEYLCKLDNSEFCHQKSAKVCLGYPLRLLSLISRYWHVAFSYGAWGPFQAHEGEEEFTFLEKKVWCPYLLATPSSQGLPTFLVSCPLQIFRAGNGESSSPETCLIYWFNLFRKCLVPSQDLHGKPRSTNYNALSGSQLCDVIYLMTSAIVLFHTGCTPQGEEFL